MGNSESSGRPEQRRNQRVNTNQGTTNETWEFVVPNQSFQTLRQNQRPQQATEVKPDVTARPSLYPTRQTLDRVEINNRGDQQNNLAATTKPNPQPRPSLNRQQQQFNADQQNNLAALQAKIQQRQSSPNRQQQPFNADQQNNLPTRTKPNPQPRPSLNRQQQQFNADQQNNLAATTGTLQAKIQPRQPSPNRQQQTFNARQQIALSASRDNNNRQQQRERSASRENNTRQQQNNTRQQRERSASRENFNRRQNQSEIEKQRTAAMSVSDNNDVVRQVQKKLLPLEVDLDLIKNVLIGVQWNIEEAVKFLSQCNKKQAGQNSHMTKRGNRIQFKRKDAGNKGDGTDQTGNNGKERRNRRRGAAGGNENNANRNRGNNRQLQMKYEQIKKMPRIEERIVAYGKAEIAVLVLIRGCPGSGRTTLARKLLNEIGVEDKFSFIISANNYFYDDSGDYKFATTQLPAAHAWNKKLLQQLIAEGRSPIFVDNIHTQSWEMKDAAELAVAYNYVLEIIEPTTPWKYDENSLSQKNSHNISAQSIKRLLDKFEKNVTAAKLMSTFNLGYGVGPPVKARKLNSPATKKFLKLVKDKEVEDNKKETNKKANRMRRNKAPDNQKNEKLSQVYECIKKEQKTEDRIFMYGKSRICVMVFMRGCPGSGKTTLAKSLLQKIGVQNPKEHIFSADDYFTNPETGAYFYSQKDITAAHAWSRRLLQQAVAEGRSPLFVDNTHIQLWEMKDSAQLGVAKGYIIETLEPNSKWKNNASVLSKCNTHGVSFETIKRALDRFEHNISGDELLRRANLEYSVKPPNVSKIPINSPLSNEMFNISRDRLPAARYPRPPPYFSPNNNPTPLFPKQSAGDYSPSAPFSPQFGNNFYNPNMGNFFPGNVHPFQAPPMQPVGPMMPQQFPGMQFHPAMGMPLVNCQPLNSPSNADNMGGKQKTPPATETQDLLLGLDGDDADESQKKWSNLQDLIGLDVSSAWSSKAPTEAGSDSDDDDDTAFDSDSEEEEDEDDDEDESDDDDEKTLLSPSATSCHFDLSNASKLGNIWNYELMKTSVTVDQSPLSINSDEKTKHTSELEKQMQKNVDDLLDLNFDPKEIKMNIIYNKNESKFQMNKTSENIDPPNISVPQNNLENIQVAAIRSGNSAGNNCLNSSKDVQLSSSPKESNVANTASSSNTNENNMLSTNQKSMPSNDSSSSGESATYPSKDFDVSSVNDVEQILLMFPTLHKTDLTVVLELFHGNVDKTVNALLDSGLEVSKEYLQAMTALPAEEEEPKPVAPQIKKKNKKKKIEPSEKAKELVKIIEKNFTTELPVNKYKDVKTVLTSVKTDLETVSDSEDIPQKEKTESVRLKLDKAFVLQLHGKFTSLLSPYMIGETVTVDLPMDLARQLHAYTVESVYQELEYEESLLEYLKEEADLQPGFGHFSEDVSNVQPKEPSLMEIMDSEIAQRLTMAQKKPEGAEGPTVAGTLSLQLLSERFPTIDKSALPKILADMNNSLHEATVLFESAGHHQIFPTEVSKSTVKNESRDDEFKGMSPEEAKIEAENHREIAQQFYVQRKQCISQAQKSSGLGNAATMQYYLQMVDWYKQLMEKANLLAAKAMLRGCEGASTLDLHTLSVAEATQVLDLFLDEHIRLLKEKGSRKTVLFIITGRGAHSVGGRPRIKNIAQQRLAARSIMFEEQNPGMLKITISRDSHLVKQEKLDPNGYVK